MGALNRLRSILHPLRAQYVGFRDIADDRFIKFKRKLKTILPGQILTTGVDGVSIKLLCRGSVAEWLLTGQDFEPGETKCFLAQLKPGMTILDIGANVGYFSLLCGLSEPSAKIYAFEPVRSTFNLLKKNIKLNRLTSIRTERLALSDSAGTATMQINSRGREGLNTMGKSVHEASDVVGTEDVPTLDLDTFLAQNSIGHVDFIKMDVEGAELLVLKGADKLLARPDAPDILFEVSNLFEKGFGYTYEDIASLLTGHGYRISLVDSDTGALTPMRANFGDQATAFAKKAAVL